MKKGRNNLKLNTISAILPQLATIVGGFLVPRLILEYFGSNVNGLVHSITQFLSIITFMEAGVGSVIRYNLYKPLYQNDKDELSKIIVSARKFFRTIAFILIGYTVILMCLYPAINENEFTHLYTATLIGAMSISYFAQYYFGQVNQLLLTADQRGYSQCLAQTFTIVANAGASVILIKMGASIHIVKLTTSVIFLLRPVFLEWYVKKHYSIDYKIKFQGEPIKQKWNGLAQHITAVILESTDVVILTIFSSLSNVSIYSAYHMVVYGIKTLMSTATSGVEALMGSIIASEDDQKIDQFFSLTEWGIHTVADFVYGCTMALIIPFIMVYTNGIHDANYNVPIFALLITLANFCHTLRLPYSIAVLTVGHYKQTQYSYIIAAMINIIVSITFVNLLGLIGVAIGTLASMTYLNAWLAWYSYRNILKRKALILIKQFFVDALSLGIMWFLGKFIYLEKLSYFSWVILALKTAVLFIVVIVFINCIFYFKNIRIVVQLLRDKHNGNVL